MVRNHFQCVDSSVTTGPIPRVKFAWGGKMVVMM